MLQHLNIKTPPYPYMIPIIKIRRDSQDDGLYIKAEPGLSSYTHNGNSSLDYPISLCSMKSLELWSMVTTSHRKSVPCRWQQATGPMHMQWRAEDRGRQQCDTLLAVHHQGDTGRSRRPRPCLCKPGMLKDMGGEIHWSGNHEVETDYGRSIGCRVKWWWWWWWWLMMMMMMMMMMTMMMMMMVVVIIVAVIVVRWWVWWWYDDDDDDAADGDNDENDDDMMMMLMVMIMITTTMMMMWKWYDGADHEGDDDHNDQYDDDDDDDDIAAAAAAAPTAATTVAVADVSLRLWWWWWRRRWRRRKLWCWTEL